MKTLNQYMTGQLKNDEFRKGWESLQSTKNNQPTAVLISLQEYEDTQKVSKLERLLERLENIRLLKLVESRANDKDSSFEKFVEEEGVSMKELEELAENVELENIFDDFQREFNSYR